MNNQETMTSGPLTRIKIIANDDCACIDFLSDLLDREPIHALQRFVSYGNQETWQYLHRSDMDEIVILILYKCNLGLNDKGNRLIIYVWNDLRGLCGYFQRWMDIVTEKENKPLYLALKDITGLLIYRWACEHENNVQSDFLG